MSTKIEKSFTTRLTKKDYLLYLLNRNIFLVISPLVIFSLVVAFVFMVYKDGFQNDDLLYLLPILLFVLSYIQMNNAINRAIESNEKTQSIKIILDELEYKEMTSNGYNSLEYSKFHSYYENKNYYYLYVDKVNALILPKREFSEEEIKQMEFLFSGTIKKTKFWNSKNILGAIFTIGLTASVIILLITML